MPTADTPDPDLKPTNETQAFTYEEVPNNVNSPMGAVDDFGRFTRGIGPDRLTRWFRAGLVVVGAVVIAALAIRMLG